MADSPEEVVRLTRSNEVLFETLKSLYESVQAVRRLQSDELAASKSSQRTDTGVDVLNDNGKSATVASLTSQLDQLKVEVEEKDYWVWKAGEFSKELTALKAKHQIMLDDRHSIVASIAAGAKSMVADPSQTDATSHYDETVSVFAHDMWESDVYWRSFEEDWEVMRSRPCIGFVRGG